MERSGMSIALAGMIATLLTSAAPVRAATDTDEEFLRSFAQLSAAEVEIGNLAAEKSRNAEVKAFGEHLADFYSTALSRITAVASQNHVDVKEGPSVKDKGRAVVLEHRGSGDFDQSYVDTQVDRHDQFVRMLQTEINEGLSPSARELAAEALPFVRRDYEKAVEIRDRVIGATSSESNVTTP